MIRRDRNILMMSGIVCAALIFIYPLALPTPLLEPDEGLHATISQEMLEHGEWIVPTFRGQPFLDKPILYFWTQMISLNIFGMHEWAVRLPGLLFGLFGSLTTGMLATRLFNREIGLVATLMSITMFLPLALAQAATHDVALVPWTNLAILCLWESQRDSAVSPRMFWLGGAACMVALAILTKALIGVAIVVIAFVVFIIVSRRFTLTRCVQLSAVLLLGLFLASPWFIAMEIRSRGYLYYYFVERHILGFATTSQPHGHEPWYFYVPFIVLGAMPWAWSFVPLCRDEWRNYKVNRATALEILLLMSWLIGGLLFLSIAKSKLSTYALPLFPAIAILTAVSWQRFMTRQCSMFSESWFICMNRLAGVVGALLPIVSLLICQSLLQTHWPKLCWISAALVSAASVASLIDFENQRYARSLALCNIWVAGITAVFMTWPLQDIAESHSERTLANWLNRQDSLPNHLILVGEKPSSVIFYLKTEWRHALRPDQLTQKRLEELTPAFSLKPTVCPLGSIHSIEAARSQALPFILGL